MKKYYITKLIVLVFVLTCSNTFISANDGKLSLKKVLVEKSEVGIHWDMADNIKGVCKVFRSTNGKLFGKVGQVSKNDTSFVDRSIEKPGLYYYQIMVQQLDTFIVSDIKQIHVDNVGYPSEDNLKSGTISIQNHTEIVPGKSYSLNVYPTVFNAELNVVLDGEVEQINLFDMAGRMLFHEKVSSKKGIHKLNLRDLKKGTYILRADEESFKVIKE